MIVIGIYGSIGTGKSTAVKYIAKKYGYFAISADRIAKKVLDTPKLKDFIKDHFPEAWNQKTQKVNRSKLREEIFQNKEKNSKLGKEMWEEISNIINNTIEASNRKKIIVEAAILPLLTINVDYFIFLITANKNKLIERVNQRDNREDVETKKILEIQDEVFKYHQKGIIIDNSDSLEIFFEKIDHAISLIENRHNI